MNPINPNPNNPIFSDDYHRFVLQDFMKPIPSEMVEPQKRFDLAATDKSQNSKKDADKEKEKKKKRPFNFDESYS